MYFTNTPSLNSVEAIMKQPPGTASEAEEERESHINTRKQTAIAGSVSTIRKRTAAPFPSARCWTSGWNAVLPL